MSEAVCLEIRVAMNGYIVLPALGLNNSGHYQSHSDVHVFSNFELLVDWLAKPQNLAVPKVFRQEKDSPGPGSYSMKSDR